MSDKPTKSGQWSQPDIGTLTRMYGSFKLSEIARKVGRPLASVNKMVAKLFSDTNGKSDTPWSATDVARLKSFYGSAGNIQEWARILKRTTAEIDRKIDSLDGEVAERPWTREDLAKIKKFYGSRGNYELRIILGMPESQIEAKAKEMCLAKDKKFVSSNNALASSTPMPRWTKEDTAALVRMHGTASNAQIAQHLERTTKAVTSKANSLGLKKTTEHLRKMGRDNVDWRYHRQQCEEVENDRSSDSNA